MTQPSRRPLRQPRPGALLWIVLALIAAGPAQALETIYLSRHADKAPVWPKDRALSALRPLSQDGMRRAELLADRLADAPIAAVYTSVTTRTVATGLPVANALQVPLTADDRTIQDRRMSQFFDDLLVRHADDEAVLLVAHSNTIPSLLAILGAREPCFERLGIGDFDGQLLIEGYEGLWLIDLVHPGCEGMERQTLVLEGGESEGSPPPEDHR